MAETQPEPWGEDPSLDALVGAQGAAALRAMFDRLPDAMCLLWALRGADGTIEDFKIGYSNPAIMRLFALQATLHADATLLGMLPQMVRSGEFACLLAGVRDGRALHRRADLRRALRRGPHPGDPDRAAWPSSATG